MARFLPGGFQDRKGKKGTGEEEDVSELVAEIEKGQDHPSMDVGKVDLSSNHIGQLPYESSSP